MCRLLFLCACAIPVALCTHFHPTTAMVDVPKLWKSGTTYMAEGFGKFKKGTGGLWTNYKKCREIRDMQRQGNEITYDEFTLLRKGKEDRMKLIQFSLMYMVAPEMVPFMLTFSPRALPSTFEGEKDRIKKLGTMSRLRTQAAAELPSKMQQEVYKTSIFGSGKKRREAMQQYLDVVDQVLAAKSQAQALKLLEPYLYGDAKLLPKIELKGLPSPVLKAACKSVGLGGGPLGFMQRGSLRTHLTKLDECDKQLQMIPLKSLSYTELEEACFDRAIGSPGSSEDALRRDLQQWLDLCEAPEASSSLRDVQRAQGKALSTYYTRMALLGINTVASARASEVATLHRRVFAKGGY